MTEEKLSKESLDKIFEALMNGRKIEAIKQYREATGEGLKDAKKAIEEITSSLGKKHPELLERQKSGCASVIVLSTVFAYTIYHFSPLVS